MDELDPVGDGISIVLELSRTADADLLARAHELLGEWLQAYEGEGAQRYRNAGVDGRAGARTLTLWADRIDDPDGGDAAIARAHAIIAHAKERLPIAAARLASVAAPGGAAASGVAASDADARARLGAPLLQVRPGGDVLAAARRAGLLPAPPGLRPSAGWLVGLFVARLASRTLDAPLASVVGSGVLALGVTVLALASRAWCRPREHALAAAVVTLAIAHAALSSFAPEEILLASVTSLALAASMIAWIIFWLRRGR